MIILNWLPNCGNEFTFLSLTTKIFAIENARSINALVMNLDLNTLKYLCKSLLEVQLI